MTRLLRLIRARRRNDEGMALVLVVGSVMVLTLIASSALAYAVASQPLSRNSQDWNAALAAAQAGVDDYIRHLNENDNYWMSVDCSNKAMLGPNKCGLPSNAKVQWQDVYADGSQAQFHYDVNPGAINSDGTVTVTATGKVNGVTRTLQVAVGRGGSTDFVYYTDYEHADPANTMVYSTPPKSSWCSGVNSSGQKVTNIYWWAGRDKARAGCTEITFIGGDILDGRVHTNDTPYMTPLGYTNPRFKQGLETSDPGCKTATKSNDYAGCWRGSGSPVFDKPPVYAEPLYLPDNSDQFKNAPGCHYSGQTRIRFTGDGYMKVWSKNSNATPECGGPGDPNGKSVKVPNNQVIYVQAGGSLHECAAGEIGDGLPITFKTGPTDKRGNYTSGPYDFVDANMREPDQYCGQGNIYVEGKVQGRVTLAASNSIVVTSDLTLKDGLNGTDMVGLVAGNSVEVYHPVSDTCNTWKTSRNVTTCTDWQDSYREISGYPKTAKGQGKNGGIEIYASIQTLQHSFYVQRYDVGNNQGTLWVYGSIAQRWRGIVGQGSGNTGYFKSYNYDTRLKFSAPPYFPQWVNAVWSARHTGEVSPLYGGS